MSLAHLIHDGSRGYALAFSQWVEGVIVVASVSPLGVDV
jgi:hypothetical protein